MKNISFSMTTEAVRNRTKTVTRRLGWWDLQPGTLLQAVEKAQGLRKGEHVKPICVIRVVSAQPMRLASLCLDDDEVVREGFAHMTPEQFAHMFCQANAGCTYGTLVNRVEFEYVEPE